MAVVLQQTYGERVLANLRKSLKTRFLFNTDYQKNAQTGTLMIPTTPEVTLGNYSKTNLASNTISYDTNGWIPCVIDQDKFLNLYLDGYDIAALPYDVIGDKLDKFGYATGLAMDTHAIATLVNAINGKDKAGNTFVSTDPRYQKAGTIVSLGSDDAYDKVVDIYGAQTDAGVAPEGRWMIVNGAGNALILKSNHAIRQGQLSQEIVMRGAIATIGGYEVYVSGNLTGNQGTGSSAKKILAIFGHRDYCTRVESFVVQPQVVDANNSGLAVGGIFVQTRIVFTHEVGKPEAFWMLTE